MAPRFAKLPQATFFGPGTAANPHARAEPHGKSAPAALKKSPLQAKLPTSRPANGADQPSRATSSMTFMGPGIVRVSLGCVSASAVQCDRWPRLPLQTPGHALRRCSASVMRGGPEPVPLEAHIADRRHADGHESLRQAFRREATQALQTQRRSYARIGRNGHGFLEKRNFEELAIFPSHGDRNLAGPVSHHAFCGDG